MVEVRPWEGGSIENEALLAIHHLYTLIETTEIPDEAPPTFEARAIRLRSQHPPERPVHHWLAEDDGRVVGAGYALRWPQDDPDNSFLWIGVTPEHRGQGVGSQMLGEMLESLEGHGCTKVIMDCPTGTPANSTLERLGLKHVFVERRSRLWMRDIDWGLMEQWIERAGERATDYRLISLETPIPEDHIERWCAVNNVMNTAPREDLDLADMIMTPAKWRAMEEMMMRRRELVRAYVAVHVPTGDFVGYTDVGVQELRPDLALQRDTAVDPAHRDKGLGRWLKAAMLKKILEGHPEVTRIYTGNAGSNQAMLGINDEMGFKPVLWLNAWQGDIAPVRSALSVR